MKCRDDGSVTLLNNQAVTNQNSVPKESGVSLVGRGFSRDINLRKRLGFSP
jgi:hypothetical protein